MSEAPKTAPKRRYYNRNRNSKAKQSTDGSENNTTSVTKTKRTRKPRSSTPTSTPTPEETRNEEIKSLVYKLSTVKNFKLINSTSKQKIFRVDIPNHNESYKLLIPILKTQSISLQSIEETPHNKNVIRNFNQKSKPSANNNETSSLFYVNYLLNNYDNLSLNTNDYKQYELNKLI